MNKFNNKNIKSVLQKYESIWAIDHVSYLSSWDLETYMPSMGSKPRGMAMAKLSVLRQTLLLDSIFVQEVESLAQDKGLNDYEKGIVRMLKRELDQYQKLPPQFIEVYEKLINESQIAWRDARQKNKFEIFAPFLEKIVAINRRKADFLGFADHPYDALLNLYEEGLTTKDLDKYFYEVREFVLELLQKIRRKPDYSQTNALVSMKYDIQKATELSEYILELFGWDKSNLRLDVSTHPFTESMASKYDVRITTRYEGTNFGSSTGSTIHEYGHALYEMQTDSDLEYTPIGRPSSLTLHESQSRFWENMIGKNPTFLSKILAKVKTLGDEFSSLEVDDLNEYFGLVSPGLIRVEADEVTYHLHILIRFEIEKGLMDGSIHVKDVRGAWNSMYEKYLGIKPSSDALGVLQDVHWSMGAIGYFSTYSLGTVVSAIWKERIEHDIGLIEEILKKDNGFEQIQNWLEKNIHQYGSTYTFKELISKSAGQEFSIEPWKKYLEHKYLGM